MYIVVEGLKGVGKSTTVESLNQRLSDVNFLHTIISPTQPMPHHIWWEKAYQYFHQDDNFIEVLYASRSNYHARNINWHDNLIIGDRSILTSLAVRWDKIENEFSSAYHFFHHVRQLEYYIGIPDISIQLHIDDNQLMQRYEKRGRRYGNAEECLNEIKRIKQNYEHLKTWLKSTEAITLLQKQIKWIDIDCNNRSVDNITNDILNIITQNV